MAKMDVPSESVEQQWLFNWARLSRGKYPELNLMYHIPNGGKRSGVREGAKLKREGVKAGVPDIHLPVARKGFHGLYIELKRRKGGSVKATQKKWLEDLKEQGYYACICRGADEAMKVIENYLNGLINQ